MQDIRETETAHMNPFLTIWTNTRETIRYVLEWKKEKFFYLLIAIAGILSLLPSVIDGSFGFDLPIGWGLLLALVLGPIVGYISTMIGAGILLLVGKLFKGEATFSEMWKTLATTQIVSIWSAPILLIGAYFAKHSYFSGPDVTEVTAVATTIDGIVAVIMIVLGIWGIVINSKAVGEAHQFSSWKGFFTILIPGFILFIVLVGIFIAIFAATFNTF